MNPGMNVMKKKEQTALSPIGSPAKNKYVAGLISLMQTNNCAATAHFCPVTYKIADNANQFQTYSERNVKN